MVEREAAGTYRVVAHGVRRPELLAALARAAGFALPPLAALPPLRLDLDLRGATLEAVLAQALADVPHDLYYAPSDDGRESVLRSVAIDLPVAAAAPSRPHEPAADEERRDAASFSPRARDPEREEDRQREIASLRDSRLDGERARAASLMHPEDEMGDLLQYLTADPSAEVRAAAATSLGDAWGGEMAYHAVDALLGALSDPDAKVAAAAVGALEDIYDVLPDPRIRKEVSALPDRGDPALQQALASFREWAEER